MKDNLFDLPAGDDRIQPMAVDWSPEQLFERSFDTTAKEAVEDALWSVKFQGTLSRRLTLAAELERKLLRTLRNDEIFAAEITRGSDKKGNLRTVLIRWIREAA